MSKPCSEWSLDEWLYNLENRYCKEINLGLSCISEVARSLNLDKPNYKVITVAGTNGKGSTVRALETLYTTAGYRVGSYTSPHLINFNERIKINFSTIPDDALCSAFNVIEEARGVVPLTYFEMVTLAALWYFNQHSLDLVVLEVGLGGRLDATNIIDADIAIITTIDYDHQEFLGTTLEAIGLEKAGILRQYKPFIFADSAVPATIIERSKELAANGYFFDKDYTFIEEGAFWSFSHQNNQLEKLPMPKIQLKSAAAALMATLLLAKELPINEEQIRKAMLAIFIPGRLQLVKVDDSNLNGYQQGGEDLCPCSINVLFDVAHNPQSVALLTQRVARFKTCRHIHAVFSALKDKDIINLISPLKKQVDYWYPAQLDNKRAVSMDLLLSFFHEAEIVANICYTTPLIAFQTALKNASTGDLIVVYGSFYTVGQIMAVQQEIL